LRSDFQTIASISQGGTMDGNIFDMEAEDNVLPIFDIKIDIDVFICVLLPTQEVNHVL
jgi:hypothetical protein